MHNMDKEWHWGFGLGHWGLGILIWLVVIFITVMLIKNMFNK